MSDLGNKEIMAKNIKYYMDLHNLERKDLCNALGFKYSTVTDWLNAEKYPRIDKIEMMANYFHISKADLVESRDKKELPVQSTLMQPSKHGVRIPVLGKVVAGIPIDAIEDIIDYEEITPELAARGEYFALQVKGESMMPTLREGDIVIVRKQPTVENGEIAIILVNGNEATVQEADW